MDYLKEFSLIRTASVGVVATRTREVRRVRDLLVSYAIQGESAPAPIFVWDARSSWMKLEYGKPTASGAPTPSKWVKEGEDCAILEALEAIPNFPKNAIAILIHPHPWFEMPRMKQTIKDFCYQFQDDNGHTLVMLVPEGIKLPVEIEADVTVLDLPLPDTKTLAESLADKIGRHRYLEPGEIISLSHAAAGMTQFEAEKSFARAAAIHIEDLANANVSALVDAVMESKVELISKSETLRLYPPVDISQVGGLAGLKHWLRFNKVRLDPAMIAKGADALRGILMVGPPGNGKSLCAKAVGSELGLPLILLELGACFGGIVGESEAKTNATMATIKALGPCIIWIDEIDKVGLSSGSNGDSGASSRMLQKLLFEMQEMSGPFWVLTANDPSKIPIELLRPGRIDEKFLVDVPGREDRIEIARIHLKKRKHAINTDLVSFSDGSEGFIAAEIEKVVVDSITYCLNHDLELTETILCQHAAAITPTSIAFAERFEEMRAWGKEHAVNASKIPGETISPPPPAKKRPTFSRPVITTTNIAKR